MYKKIAAIQNQGDARDVVDELIDRWGEPPASVSGLVDISLIRVTAARVGIDEIAQKGQYLILYSPFLTPYRLKDLAAGLPGRFTINAAGRNYLSIRLGPGEKATDLLRLAVGLLPPLEEAS